MCYIICPNQSSHDKHLICIHKFRLLSRKNDRKGLFYFYFIALLLFRFFALSGLRMRTTVRCCTVLYCSTNQCGEISDSLTPGGMLASGLAVCLTRTPRSESQDSYVQYSTVQYVALLDRAHRETTALIEGRGLPQRSAAPYPWYPTLRAASTRRGCCPSPAARTTPPPQVPSRRR